MAKCKFCGFDMEDSAGFCPRCGAKPEKNARRSVYGSMDSDTVGTDSNRSANSDRNRTSGNRSYQNNDNNTISKYEAEKQIGKWKMATFAAVIFAVFALSVAIIAIASNSSSPQVRYTPSWEEVNYEYWKMKYYELLEPTATPVITEEPVATVTPEPHVSPLEKTFYRSADGILYYYETYNWEKAGWWQYDTDSATWTQSEEKEHYENQFRFGLDLSNAIGGLDELKQQLVADGLITEDTDIRNTGYNIFHVHEYIDAFPQRPERGYYVTQNGDVYYYLRERNLSNMTKELENVIGWYYFDAEAGWRFITKGENVIELGEELWYNLDNCFVGEHYQEYRENSQKLVSDRFTSKSLDKATDFETDKADLYSRIDLYGFD